MYAVPEYTFLKRTRSVGRPLTQYAYVERLSWYLDFKEKTSEDMCLRGMGGLSADTWY